ncbi:type IVB secretion system coupling complex protein DotM/IcmP [Thiotrichales bacterium 19S11-10]|nr:type IVB secretion system coupling complex protein DotM/IcmP [Thiotrichales bacterium 19S11-10]
MNKGNKSDESGAGLALFIGGVLAALLLLYYYYHNDIVSFLFLIKTFELKLITVFSPSYQQLVNWTEQTLKSKVTLEDLYYLSLNVSTAFRIPIVIVGFGLAALLYYRHPKARFKDKFSTNDISENMSNFFPAVLPVLGKNLQNKPLLEGAWSMALTPVEFAQKYNLIHSDNGKNTIIQDKAFLVLVNQLGERFTNHYELPLHRQMLFTAFITYINKDRISADSFLKDMAKHFSNPKKRSEILLTKKMNTLLEKYAETSKVKKIINSHAYTYTVFTGLLWGARSSGIVSTSSFLWLKPLDRELWYVLNNIGRRAVYAEAGAVHAHYLAESRLKKAITYPMVTNAIAALQTSLDMVILTDEDDE